MEGSAPPLAEVEQQPPRGNVMASLSSEAVGTKKKEKKKVQSVEI